MMKPGPFQVSSRQLLHNQLRPSVASTAGGQTRICHVLKKARICQLCNCSSSDESPLDYVGRRSSPRPLVGCLGEANYDKAKAQDGETVRAAKLCLNCLNVYRALSSSIAIMVSILPFVSHLGLLLSSGLVIVVFLMYVVSYI